MTLRSLDGEQVQRVVRRVLARPRVQPAPAIPLSARPRGPAAPLLPRESRFALRLASCIDTDGRSPQVLTASRRGRSGSGACCQRSAMGSRERLELAPPCLERHLILFGKFRTIDRPPQQLQDARLGELPAPVCRKNPSAIHRRHARRVEFSNPMPGKLARFRDSATQLHCARL